VWRKIAMASWRPRKDPAILATIDVDAEALLRYIEQVRSATGAHVTAAHLVGRAGAKVTEALPGLNGRVVLGQFVSSPTIDCSFVVSLRTDPSAGTEATKTDLSGSVVRNVDQKPPWVIAQELADDAALIRADRDPQFKQTKQLVRWLPPLALRAVTDAIGFVTDGLQLPIPFLGLDARPYGSFLVSNVGTYGLDSAFAPVPPFCHVPAVIMVGAITDKVVARDGQPVVRPTLPLAIGLDHRFVDGYQAATDGEDLPRVSGGPRTVRSAASREKE
jgi:pyruvate dehydrogenase E2 component (dihydrolipoamide acetyltransferase)